MRCPTLAELPSPPPGKTGWPWTAEAAQMPSARVDDSPWPRISIVTPSYNQGRFIEETIRSVLLQGYPDLEYIIIDGGSSDESVDLIKKYAPWLTYWISESDRGQSHAINKGFGRASGTILNWLNSDDVFAVKALAHVGAAFERQWIGDVFAGLSEFRASDGGRSVWKIEEIPQTYLDLCRYLEGRFLAQPSVFFRRSAFDDVGRLKEELCYAMDLDLWLRFAKRRNIVATNVQLSWMRHHDDAKTFRNELAVLDEVDGILELNRKDIPFALLRVCRKASKLRRSDVWSRKGLGAYFSGDRRAAWQAAWRALAQTKLSVFRRIWLSLVVRLACPKRLTTWALDRP